MLCKQVVETTNHIFSPGLLDVLSPRTVPSWLRVRSAFMLAGSGAEWVELFSGHNSGTYNNQYMVVDLNRFRPYENVMSGFLWVVEQVSGWVRRGGWTGLSPVCLRQGVRDCAVPNLRTAASADET